MSGPKVVRIVTREEIEAICRRHIMAVTAAVREAAGRAKRCDKLTNVLQQSLTSRIATLEALFSQGQWMAIQKQAPEVIVFLKSEGDRLEKQATEEAARARTRRRRSMDAARSVAAALQAAGVSIDPSLERAIKGRSASLDEADRAIAAALAAIPVTGRSEAALAGQAALSARLSKGETGRSVAELVAAQQAKGAASDERLDRLIAEIHVLGDAAATFTARADAIAGEVDAVRRRLQTDSLIMDVAARVTQLRKREAIDGELRQAAASLEGVETTHAGACRAKLDAVMGQADEVAAKSLAAEAVEIAEAHVRAVAASARRKAVLAGLSSLGYEVRETMSSAWERKGRLIVKKPGDTDYGVELGAPADATRFQVRLVGSSTPEVPRDAQRDADQEVMWCGDFERLRAGLVAHGDEVVLERAVEAGKLPLRSVEMPREIALELNVRANSSVLAKRSL